MIFGIIRSYANQWNFEDMKQAAELGFMRALRTYKKGKAGLGTWVFIKVRKECQNQKQLEYITTSCSETRRHLPVEER